MEPSTDLYAILGVLPSAEDIVIRAAYRALSQRYHPDRCPGDKTEAERRMRDINGAYEVLSSAEKREQYDLARKGCASNDRFGAAEDGVREAFEEGKKSFSAEWAIAREFYPELEEICNGLNKTSYRLTFAFQAYLLNTKQFASGEAIAGAMEDAFLETYFGTDKLIVEFAKHLIALGENEAAKELNRAVAVLGSEADAGRIIDKINRKYKFSPCHVPAFSQVPGVKALAERVARGSTINEAKALLKAVGGLYAEKARSSIFAFCSTITVAVTLQGTTHRFASPHEFSRWMQRIAAKAISGNE